MEEIDINQLAFRWRPSGEVSKPPCAAAYENKWWWATRIKRAEKICSGTTEVSWTKVNRSMKPRKGKTMSKADGYVCIFDRNTTDTGIRVVSHPGLRRQDTPSGSQMKPVMSVWCGQTEGRETSAKRWRRHTIGWLIMLKQNHSQWPRWWSWRPTGNCVRTRVEPV